MKIKTLGIDLAKNSFHLCGVDERGKVIVKKRRRRKHLLAFLANLEPCLIGLEACGGSNYWAREMGKLGHVVRLMSPQFVKPYIKKGNKNDYNDAEGICEAVSRPTMRIPLKVATHSTGKLPPKPVKVATLTERVDTGVFFLLGLIGWGQIYFLFS